MSLGVYQVRFQFFLREVKQPYGSKNVLLCRKLCPGGGRYSDNFSLGVCCWDSENLNLY